MAGIEVRIPYINFSTKQQVPQRVQAIPTKVDIQKNLQYMANKVMLTSSIQPLNTTENDIEWSILDGSLYATVDSSTGELTIKDNAITQMIKVRAKSISNNSIYEDREMVVTYRGNTQIADIEYDIIVDGLNEQYVYVSENQQYTIYAQLSPIIYDKYVLVDIVNGAEYVNILSCDFSGNRTALTFSFTEPLEESVNITFKFYYEDNSEIQKVVSTSLLNNINSILFRNIDGGPYQTDTLYKFEFYTQPIISNRNLNIELLQGNEYISQWYDTSVNGTAGWINFVRKNVEIENDQNIVFKFSDPLSDTSANISFTFSEVPIHRINIYNNKQTYTYDDNNYYYFTWQEEPSTFERNLSVNVQQNPNGIITWYTADVSFGNGKFYFRPYDKGSDGDVSVRIYDPQNTLFGQDVVFSIMGTEKEIRIGNNPDGLTTKSMTRFGRTDNILVQNDNTQWSLGSYRVGNESPYFTYDYMNNDISTYVYVVKGLHKLLTIFYFRNYYKDTDEYIKIPYVDIDLLSNSNFIIEEYGRNSSTGRNAYSSTGINNMTGSIPMGDYIIIDSSASISNVINGLKNLYPYQENIRQYREPGWYPFNTIYYTFYNPNNQYISSFFNELGRNNITTDQTWWDSTNSSSNASGEYDASTFDKYISDNDVSNYQLDILKVPHKFYNTYVGNNYNYDILTAYSDVSDISTNLNFKVIDASNTDVSAIYDFKFTYNPLEITYNETENNNKRYFNATIGEPYNTSIIDSSKFVYKNIIDMIGLYYGNDGIMYLQCRDNNDRPVSNEGTIRHDFFPHSLYSGGGTLGFTTLTLQYIDIANYIDEDFYPASDFNTKYDGDYEKYYFDAIKNNNSTYTACLKKINEQQLTEKLLLERNNLLQDLNGRNSLNINYEYGNINNRFSKYTSPTAAQYLRTLVQNIDCSALAHTIVNSPYVNDVSIHFNNSNYLDDKDCWNDYKIIGTIITRNSNIN